MSVTSKHPPKTPNKPKKHLPNRQSELRAQQSVPAARTSWATPGGDDVGLSTAHPGSQLVWPRTIPLPTPILRKGPFPAAGEAPPLPGRAPSRVKRSGCRCPRSPRELGPGERCPSQPNPSRDSIANERWVLQSGTGSSPGLRSGLHTSKATNSPVNAAPSTPPNQPLTPRFELIPLQDRSSEASPLSSNGPHRRRWQEHVPAPREPAPR